MVDFGGWDMPVNYGSQIDEHHAVRGDAGMFDVSHMRVVDLAGAGARAFLRYALANNVDKLHDPRQGALLVPAARGRRRARRPHRLLPARRFLPPRRQRRHRRQGHRVACARCSRAAVPRVTLTPRTDLALIAVQGPQARAKLWRALPGSEAATCGARAVQRGDADGRRRRLLHRAHRLHRRGRLRDRGAGDARVALWNALRRGRRQALRARRARHAAPRGRHEPLRPGHGRGGVAARGGACAGPWTCRAPRDFVGTAALDASAPGARRWSGSCCWTAGGVLRAHQRVSTPRRRGRDHQRHVLADDAEIDRARARAARRRRRATACEVEVRDKLLAARVVKPPFVRNGKVLV